MKQFKTIEEQIDLLQERGLQISDRKYAANFLLKNNYYRVSGYSLTLRNHDVFYNNATFQNIVDIYNYDFELRHILQYYLEIIETDFKSILAYEFTKEYGPDGYLNVNNFSNPNLQATVITKSEEMMKKRLSNEPFLKHYYLDLHEPIPFWAYVDLFTFANISMFYSACTDNIKSHTSIHYNIPGKRSNLLSDFMHHMTILRNLCAHGGRLFNRYFEQKPRLSKQEKALLRRYENGDLDNDHLFSYILVMRRLLSIEDYTELIHKLKVLCDKYPFVGLRYYGIPNIDVLD